jgi:hypothetical protein
LNDNIKAFDYDLNLREKALFTKCYKINFEQRYIGWKKMDVEFKLQENRDAKYTTNKFLRCIKEMKKKLEDEMRQMCKEAYTEAKYYSKKAQSLES